MIRLAKISGATLAIYVFVIVLLRVTGRRQLAELTIIDLVVLLCLGSAVETAMIRGDVSLEAGVVSALTLLIANRLLALAVLKSKRMRRLAMGGPVLVVHGGQVIPDAAKRAGLTEADILEACREREVASTAEVRFAVVETDGSITVVPFAQSRPPSRP